MTTSNRPQRLAAPAPGNDADETLDDQATDGDGSEALDGPSDAELHALCERWARWCQTRRYYGRNSLPPSILGRLTSPGTGRSIDGGPDAECSAELAAFHLAVLAQPSGKARQVFELHYLHRVRNVKVAAHQLHVSRRHWYRLLNDFRRAAYTASVPILSVRQDRQ